MENYLQDIKKKLENKINFEKIENINNTEKHKNHKFFVKEKYHLHLKVKSMYLSSLTKLSAHKIIMKILKEDLKSRIHALEISIE